MSRRLFLVLTCVFGLSGLAAAQNKNITNADLEKFKEKRLRTEREYRENYAKLGMPSPEDLEKSAERKRRENAEVAARLRVERLADERTQALREQAETQAAAANNSYNQPIVQRTYLQTNSGYAPFGYYTYQNNPRDYTGISNITATAMFSVPAIHTAAADFIITTITATATGFRRFDSTHAADIKRQNRLRQRTADG